MDDAQSLTNFARPCAFSYRLVASVVALRGLARSVLSNSFQLLNSVVLCGGIIEKEND